MAYLIIGVLVVICVAICISIVNRRGEYRYKILMMLLMNEEKSDAEHMVICYGRDSAAVDKLLKEMVKGGYLDQIFITRPGEAPQPVYKLTRQGYRFAIQLRNTYRRRNS